jgi:hypothetical protein
MGHPLTPDLSKMNMEDLTNKFNELNKRLNAAFRMGKSDMVGQLQLLLQDYKAELDNRQRAQMEEMMNSFDKYKKIIDIE